MKSAYKFKPRSSTLMKPTASQLAKQKKARDLYSSQFCGRSYFSSFEYIVKVVAILHWSVFTTFICLLKFITNVWIKIFIWCSVVFKLFFILDSCSFCLLSIFLLFLFPPCIFHNICLLMVLLSNFSTVHCWFIGRRSLQPE